MLAWESIMLFEGSNGLGLECVSIGTRHSFFGSEIIAFSANGIVFAESVGTKADVKNEITLQMPRKLKPTSQNALLKSITGKSERELRGALSWISYTEED
jgi:hypothetical protein